MTTEPNQTAPVENETPPIVAETTDASAADALEDLALTPAPSAQTTPTKRKKAFSKRTVEDLAIQPHRAADCVIIPGDSSEDGQRYAGTPLDDLRQNLPWGDVHETILTGLLASAEMIKHPDGHGLIAVNKGAPISVYAMGNDDNIEFVVENGRQRTRVARVLNERLAFVAAWCAQHAEWTTLQARRKHLLSEAGTHEWITEDFVRLAFGTSEFGTAGDRSWIVVKKDKSVEPPVTTFTPVEFWLTLSVAGFNPSLTDNTTLLNMIARQDNRVETPRSIRAQNIARLMGADGNGNKLTSDAIGKMTGVSSDTVQNDVRFLQLIPEVQAAIEADRVSQTVVLSGAGRKAGCLFTKVDGTLVPLAEDQQRKIWTALLSEYPADSEGNIPKIFGTKGFNLGLKIQKAILDGKEWNEDAKAAVETAQSAEQTTQANQQQSAPSSATPSQTAQSAQQSDVTPAAKPSKGKGTKIDYARYYEHLDRAIASAADPTESGLTDSIIVERSETRAALTAAKAVLAFIGGDRSALKDVPPVLRDALLAATADAEPVAAPIVPANVKEQADDLLYGALTSAMAIKSDFAPSECAIADRLSDGSEPSDDAVHLARTTLAKYKADFAAQSDVSVFYDYVQANLVA